MNEVAIEVKGLSKRFGQVQAVRDLSFVAAPGRVTGFLGPNGSGKTTTLSMLLGLVRPDSGTSTVGGKPYRQLERPTLVVGSALSANFHPAHTGREHLDIARRAIGVPVAKVDENLALVGLTEAADRKSGGYSLGMRQRLALAASLLGDPQVLVLDEPINGLDPQGIRWIREFLRHLASRGKTILLSSHLLSEVQQTVDDVVIIRRGELAYAGTLAELEQGAGEEVVHIDAEDRGSLTVALTEAGGTVHGAQSGPLRVTGLSARTAGQIALRASIPLDHLSVDVGGLEQRFLDLVDQGDAMTAGGAQ